MANHENQERADQRYSLRFTKSNIDGLQKIADRLNVPLLHLMTMSVGIGAKYFERQTLVLDEIPAEVWRIGFQQLSESMDEEKMMLSMSKLADTPEGIETLKKLASMDSGNL